MIKKSKYNGLIMSDSNSNYNNNTDITVPEIQILLVVKVYTDSSNNYGMHVYA